MTRSAFIFFLTLILNSSIAAQPVSEKVKSLQLQSIDSGITTYYSANYKHRAESIKLLLGKSAEYFENTFDINEEFELAVLDSADWIRITQIPYGLPFVSGPPNIVCIPASNENILARVIHKAVEGYNLSPRYAKPTDEIINLFISLIGFHELGHIYARACDINFPNKWTFEFAATYFAFLYLKEYDPGIADLWVDIAKILAKEIDPVYTSLNDFEELYVKVGVENYAWYQVVFLLRVAETENEAGINFIETLKQNNLLNSGDDLSISSLENEYPGFISWAKKYNLVN